MISVITPVFNGERYIEACIKAVIEQDCSDTEHVIIDGASTDRTVNIIKEYAEKYEHIRWLSEKDNGQSDGLNRGLELALGDIVTILNVDDYYEPNVLNQVIELFERLPEPSFLVGNCNVWDNDGKFRYKNKPSALGVTDLLLGWKFFPHPVNPSAYFYHKKVHDIIGPYRQDMQIGQDLPFLLSVVQAANVKYVDRDWGNWPVLDGALTDQDVKAGLAKERYGQVMAECYDNLSWVKKIIVSIKRAVYVFLRKSKNKIKRIMAG